MFMTLNDSALVRRVKPHALLALACARTSVSLSYGIASLEAICKFRAIIPKKLS